MLACFAAQSIQNATPIHLVDQGEYADWLTRQDEMTKNWLYATGYKAENSNISIIPSATGSIAKVICCVMDKASFWCAGHLPMNLPEGVYAFSDCEAEYDERAVAWGLGAYQFTRYKKPSRTPAQLVLSEKCDASYVAQIVESIYLVRDLINTPTDDMGPSELADAAVKLSKENHAKIKQVIGTDLLKNHFASIYTVGRASDDAPRLLDLRWGSHNHPKVTLVGKGVCFDTGGLDIKNSAAMLLMKKDMGGAAHVLGLARMIMQANLPIQLRVLIPAVENSISGNAYRPGDVIKSRNGMTIEIGNTDAEGRVVLADALTEAVSEQPDLIIDIATLTGAARVALGTELPALFSNNDKVAHEIIQHGKLKGDPVWQLPLFGLYRESLNSAIADINNNSTDVYGGAITAALFLKEFVPDNIPWVHLDMMAWNLRSRAGRPQGGEAMALRGIFSYLHKRFGV